MGTSGSTNTSTKVVQLKPTTHGNTEDIKESVFKSRNSNATVKREKNHGNQKVDCTLTDIQNEEKVKNNETSKFDQNQNRLHNTESCIEDIALTSVTPLAGKSFNNTSGIQSNNKNRESNDEREARQLESRAMALLSVTPSAQQTTEVGHDVKFIADSANTVIIEDETDVASEEPTSNVNQEILLSKAEDINLDFVTPRPKSKTAKASSLTNVNALVENFWAADAPDDVLPCWVHGLASLADGYILVLDINNNKLKLFDEKYSFCCDVTVSEECRGITSVYSNEVAMTCGSEVLFYYVDKDGFIEQQRCFKLNGEGYGISYGHKNFAVTCDISDRKKACVRILNDKGKQRYVIKSCYGSSVKMVKYVQLDHAKDIVYISDVRNKRIVSMTFEGSELWMLNIEDEPRYILCMPSYLLVADHRLHQLLQISYDGTESRALLTEDDDLWNPELLIFNLKTNHLLISTPENIMVFKIV